MCVVKPIDVYIMEKKKKKKEKKIEVKYREISVCMTHVRVNAMIIKDLSEISQLLHLNLKWTN